MYDTNEDFSLTPLFSEYLYDFMKVQTTAQDLIRWQIRIWGLTALWQCLGLEIE